MYLCNNAELMAHHRISCVIILSSHTNIPIGILTERDMVRFHSNGMDYQQIQAASVMSTPLSTVNTEDSLWSIHQQMIAMGVRRLVVTYGNGELAGIITQTQMLQRIDPTEMYQVMAQMQQTINLQTEELRQLNDQLQIVNQKLQQLSTEDELTKIANRRGFNHHLETSWKHLLREVKPLSVILCDIDEFKKFNDIYGHLVGDRCLEKVAEALHQSAQRPTDLVARYGGEEFAVILPNTDAKGAVIVAEQIQSTIADLRISHQGSLVSPYITLSMGIATTIPTAGSSTTALLDLADRLLYQSKQSGRNTYSIQDQMNSAAETMARLG
jgi:diguanylate cyclase (GGDEF)-like protein